MKLGDDQALDLLFSRLTWPSSLTRGRAARALARLLAKEETRERTASALERRFSSENLESRSADLLLIVLMAREEARVTVVAPERLRGQIQYPSILSQLVFEELGLWEDRALWKTFHSETAPGDFFIDRYFERNTQACLPPIYQSMAETIENDHHAQFFRQWAFESSRLIERTGLSQTPPSHFPGQTRDDHYFSLEYPQSDLYRSSFMRALSWAHSKENVDQGFVWLTSLRICPVDVGLACVSVKSKPDWWPSRDRMPPEHGPAVSLIWNEVAELWNKRIGGQDSEWVPVMATGPVWRSENTLYTLEVLGGYQTLRSLELPAVADVFKWLKTVRSGEPGNFGIVLGGKLTNVESPVRPRRFGGWEVRAVAGHLESWTGPRWQFWRLGRVWAPMSELSAEAVTIEPSEDALEFKVGGVAIARWQDWAQDFKEVLEANLPVGAGQVLLLKGDLVRKLAAESSSSLCWFCRITIYNRKSSWGRFDQSEHFRMFGEASRIITAA